MQATQSHQADTGARYVGDLEACRILGLSRSYLRRLRVEGGGPTFSSFGRAVRYRVDNLYSWADSRARSSTSEQVAA